MLLVCWRTMLFVGAVGAVGVTEDDAGGEGALDLLIEDEVTGDIGEAGRGRIGRGDVEAVGDHLGELAAGDGLVGAEGAVGVAAATVWASAALTS